MQSNKNKTEITKTKFGRRINISKNEISMNGNLKKETFSLFIRKFDLLINFFTQKEILSELISSKCFSKLRLGFSKVNPQINDVVFNFDLKEKKIFLSESMNYLNSFTK